MDIPPKLRPLYPGNIVRDGSFQGAHDSNLSRAMNAYALRACGNCAHYHFHTQWSAPERTVAVKETWYDFQLKGYETTTFEVPWHHQNSHWGIRCQLRLVTDARCFMTARLVSDDLIDAVAQSTGAGQVQIPTEISTFTAWNSTTWDNVALGQNYPGDTWRVHEYNLTLEAPTLPANRRVAVRPQIYLSAVADILIGLAGDPTFWVESMVLMDIADPDSES